MDGVPGCAELVGEGQEPRRLPLGVVEEQHLGHRGTLMSIRARRGIWLTGDQLAPPRRARSVSVRDGKTIVTDGPFAETKEAVGGFDLLECESLEEAVEIAASHPMAEAGTIEVRPLWGSR
jgi:hypothetical protein